MRIPLQSLFFLLFLPADSTFSQETSWEQLPKTKIGPEILNRLESHPGLPYANYGDRELQLDLFRPKDAKKPLPGIICIHGGAWWKGERRNFAHVAQALAARGYVTATISYRLSDESPFPAQIHDCKAAVRWMRANAEKYGINPELIAATGSSAGGHLAALLATSGGVDALEGEGGNPEFSSSIQAAAPMGAQSDLMTERIARRSKDPAAAFYPQFLGGTQEEASDTYRLASPRHHLDSKDPPLFFLAGEFDDPSTRAATIRKEMTELGIPNSFILVQGAPHPFPSRQPFFEFAIEKIDLLFSSTLK